MRFLKRLWHAVVSPLLQIQTRLRAGFSLFGRVGLEDMHILGGLALVFAGAWRIDENGALLLVGSISVLIGLRMATPVLKGNGR